MADANTTSHAVPSGATLGDHGTREILDAIRHLLKEGAKEKRMDREHEMVDYYRQAATANSLISTFIASVATASIFQLEPDDDRNFPALAALGVTLAFSLTALTMSALLLVYSIRLLVGRARYYRRTLEVVAALSRGALLVATCLRLATVSQALAWGVGVATGVMAVAAFVLRVFLTHDTPLQRKPERRTEQHVLHSPNTRVLAPEVAPYSSPSFRTQMLFPGSEISPFFEPELPDLAYDPVEPAHSLSNPGGEGRRESLESDLENGRQISPTTIPPSPRLQPQQPEDPPNFLESISSLPLTSPEALTQVMHYFSSLEAERQLLEMARRSHILTEPATPPSVGAMQSHLPQDLAAMQAHPPQAPPQDVVVMEVPSPQAQPQGIVVMETSTLQVRQHSFGETVLLSVAHSEEQQLNPPLLSSAAAPATPLRQLSWADLPLSTESRE
ncbi:hypothetical protein HDU93_001975 [Gonapodya sp. JEL0774]|nr:hypothetical protein HDU93_001975 [Gonapodya sp. JEL0774]